MGSCVRDVGPVRPCVPHDDGRLESAISSHLQFIPAHEVVLRQQLLFHMHSRWWHACRAVRSRKATNREIDILAGRRVLSAAEPTLDGLPSSHDISPKGLTVDLYLRDIVVEANHDTRRIPIYSSARMMVTRNLHKEPEVVNDEVRHVLHFSRACVVLRLDSDVEAAIHKMAYETEDGSNYVAYPLEIGYACTLANVQGDTIEKLLYV